VCVCVYVIDGHFNTFILNAGLNFDQWEKGV
jgi:hypothetical protein